jgi:hypothetical protein
MTLPAASPTVPPTGGAGSFTRFVLPFAYQPEAWAGSEKPPAAYREDPGVDAGRMLARREYFTSDTGTVLFERAKWCALSASPECHEIKGRFGKTLLIAMMPPRLVLFEWPEPKEPPHLQMARDIMRTGFLLVDVQFLDGDAKWDFEDVLAFNETFRYWRRPWPGQESENRAGYVYRDMVPGFDEHAPYFNRWADMLRHPVQLGGKQYSLFPGAEKGDGWFAEAMNWQQSSQGKPGWIPYADNRTFVWSCALFQKSVAPIQKPDDVEYGRWVKFLNVDPPRAPLEGATRFERNWADDRTYYRWSEFGSLYGFSYHSGVLLAPSDPKLNLACHFSDMYFDMVLLLFYLRVSCFRFSRELCKISEQLPKTESKERGKYLKDLRRLRLSFALFTNSYQFPLLSNQQQGLEMYEIAKKSLDVEELFHEVRDKIRSVHEYIELQVAHHQNRAVLDLTLVAQFGLVPLIALGLFGTKPFEEGIRPWGIRTVTWILERLGLGPNYAPASFDIGIFLVVMTALYIVFFYVVPKLLPTLSEKFQRWEDESDARKSAAE